MSRIHCTGIGVVDALSGPIDGYPIPRERTQVNTKSLRFATGGGAVNTSSALARMGLDVTVYTKIGGDLMGRFLLEELAACGVNTSRVLVSENESTPFTFVGIHPGGNRTFIHTPGANLTFGLADLDLDSLLDTQFLLYQDFWILPSLDGPDAASLLAEARRRGVVTLLDECWGAGPDWAKLAPVLQQCDYVIPSYDDMLFLYPDRSPEDIARIVLDEGAGVVVVKMGAEGCLVAADGRCEQVPAFDVPVVDTTGAGDCWDAGFVAGLADGLDVVTSARLGCACAGFCVQNVGGSAGIPRYADVKALATG
jgi:sugar/nucleoside kinase (ribokinase family)